MRLQSVLTGVCVLAATLLLSACLGEQVDKKIDDRRPIIEAGAKRAEAPASSVSYDPLQVTNQVWAGGRAIRMRRGLPLPTTYEGPKAITLVSSKEMSLADIAAFVTSQTGVPVRLTDGAEQMGSGSAVAGAARPSASAAARPATPTAGGATATSTATSGATNDVPPMTLAYEGPMSGLLDTVAGHFGVSWKYDGAAVVMSRYETRTFLVEAMPGTASVTDGLQADSGGSTSSAASTSGASTGTSALDQKSQLTATLDYWTELQDTLNTILGGVGAVKTSPSSGSVTVITTPEIMRTVAQYIETENTRNTRQVAITLELFTLAVSNTENYGLDLDVAFQKADLPRFGFNGPPSNLTTTAFGEGLSVNVLSPTSNFADTSALVKALSTLGSVSRVARIPLTTLNNRPASRRIGRDKAYLASASVSQSGSSDFQQSTLTPGVVREGFSLQITPRILGDGRMLIQFSLSVIDLVGNIRTFSTPDDSSSVELPETNSRVFVQQALLNNGDMLVLSGFDQDQQTSTDSGFGSPYNWMMGGSKVKGDSRELLFLTITPRELNVPARLPNS